MRPLAPLLLLATALAGCLGPAPPADPGPGAPPPAPAGWARDCAISNWGDPCTAKATQTHGPANELMLAVNPSDPKNVVIGAKDYTPEGSDCVWAGTSVTKDGGATWTNGWVGGDRANRDPRLAAYDCVTDPVLEFTPDGLLYYLVEAYNAGRSATSALPDPIGLGLGAFGVGSQMLVAASTDGGESWELRGLVTAGPGGAVLLHDKSDLAVSPVTGTVAVSWTAFSPAVSQLLWTRSTDAARSFGPPHVLMEVARAQEPTAMVDLEWDAEGVLHALWFNWGTGEVMYARSVDDGLSFGTPRSLAAAQPWTGQTAPNAEYRIFDGTMMAIDTTGGPRRGWVYATWADDLIAADDHDVWLMVSEDGGDNWARPTQVGSHTGSDQFHPNLAVAPDGSLHLFFYDRGYAPGNTLLDVTHGLSLDGGATWAWTRVTSTSFDGDLGIHQNGFPFMGDYNGIGAAGDVLYLTYADTREGRSEVAVSKWTRPPMDGGDTSAERAPLVASS